MIYKPCRIFKCIALAVLILPVFFSCSNQAQENSIASALDQIDILINQNQYRDAERELSKIEKKSYSSWTEIGIFRRYVQIDLKDKAEKLIVRAIKKNPENGELNAVYTNFLLRNGRIEEALKVGKVLQGSKYGSIYSEAVFKDTLEKSKKEELYEIFRSGQYFPVYYDAYTGSKEPFWLRNCALLKLSSGAYEGASQIHPDVQDSLDAVNAYFWALVMYDARRFSDSVLFSEEALRLLEGVSGRAKKLVSFSKVTAVLQDSYTWLNDAYEAERIRSEYLESITDYKGNIILPEDEESLALIPYILVNSSKWAKDTDDGYRAVNLLTLCVENWRDYVPALVSYADFAYNSSLMRKEDLPKMQLRDEGLASLEMEKYDSRAKIPLADALSRIDESLERYKEPLLFIVRLDLKYKTQNDLSDTEKIADVWRVLEENAVSPSVYPPLLFEYALSFLLEKKMYDDAWKLFYKYIGAKYSIAADEKFWLNLVKKAPVFTSGESEYAFYFAALSQKIDESVRLGEYSVFENGMNGENKYISTIVSDNSVVNLASIYYSLGRKTDAMDLYGKVNGRSSDKLLKSIVMYRMALIYLKNNDFKNAKLCAEYCVNLNPGNAEAKLLLAKLKI